MAQFNVFQWKWPEKIIILLLAAVVSYLLVLVTLAYTDGFDFGRRAPTALSEAILLTDKDCSELGNRWKRYKASGRFLVASGRGEDINGIARTFDIHSIDEEGEYAHALTVEELASHTHTQSRGHSGNDMRCGGTCDEYASPGPTSSVGDNLPHNNIPPYFVLNFCVTQ